jgi:hypothetical protein
MKRSDIIYPLALPMNSFKKMLDGLTTRLPPWGDVLGVFNIVVFIIYSWEIWVYLFGLPSLMFYLGAGDVASVFLYAMAFALIESVLVTSAAVILSIILPSKWLRDGFTYKGSLGVLVAAVTLLSIRNHLGSVFPPVQLLLQDFLISALICALLFVVFHNAARPRIILLTLIERFSVFLYLYVPLGVIGLLVVLVRNLL